MSDTSDWNPEWPEPAYCDDCGAPCYVNPADEWALCSDCWTTALAS